MVETKSGSLCTERGMASVTTYHYLLSWRILGKYLLEILGEYLEILLGTSHIQEVNFYSLSLPSSFALDNKKPGTLENMLDRYAGKYLW